MMQNKLQISLENDELVISIPVCVAMSIETRAIY